MGDSLAHYYCLEKHSSRFKDEFVSDHESFFIGTEDNQVECMYDINRYWYEPAFYLFFTDKDNAGSDDSD